MLEPVRAALLAYLALAGETSRARLTELLWPGQPPRQARNNLAQQLHRLRRAHPDVVVGEDPVSLAAGLLVDAHLLRAACDRQDYRAALECAGELLAGIHFDEEDPDGGDDYRREELHRWLQGERLRLRGLQCKAHLEEVQRLEREGRLPEALDLTRRLCTLDDTSEDAWFTLMRLHQRMGERTAALSAYDECKRVLRRKLDVEPSEEIRHLARRIEREDAAPPRPPQSAHRQLPPGVISPPRLVGREREWAEMEAAFQARKPIFIFGEAGVGKSRLIADFARSKGQFIWLDARPGDHDVPYASHVRNGRKLLQQRRKDGRPPLPDWVVEQLASRLPELGAARAPPPAEEDKTRFLDAATELFRDTCRDLDVVVFDNGQYIDPPSFELGIYIHNQLWFTNEEGVTERRPFPPLINGYRGSQVEPRWLELIHDLVSMGLVARIELKPLDTPAVAELLRSLEIPGLQELAGELARYTGGNPLFVVETVKHLLATGWRPGSRPAVLPLADPVRHVIRARLKGLSPRARLIAQVVAVARANTSLDVVAAVLGVQPLDLVGPYRELEEQGVLAQEWFTHDVLGEVLLEDTPEQVRASLRKPKG